MDRDFMRNGLPLVLENVKTAFRALFIRRLVIHCDEIPYEFENISLRKILNWLAVETSIFLKKSRAWGLPTHIMIEPSTLCNIRCVHCPTVSGMSRPVGLMDYELFRKVIDEIGDALLLILLWDWGEPFMNPSIYRMIRHAKSLGIKVISSTNGHLFAQTDHAERLVESGIDTIIFAVDGVTEESYETYRSGGDLQTVLSGIRNVVDARTRAGSNTPLVNFRFVAMRHNEHEVLDAMELARSLGADAFTLKSYNPNFDSSYGEREASEYLVPERMDLRRFSPGPGPSPGRVRVWKNPCRNLWNNPSLHWDGHLCICTYDYDERYCQGSLRNRSFRSVWYGKSYHRIRRLFRKDWEAIPICRDCTYAFEGGSSIDETIRSATFFHDARRKAP